DLELPVGADAGQRHRRAGARSAVATALGPQPATEHDRRARAERAAKDARGQRRGARRVGGRAEADGRAEAAAGAQVATAAAEVGALRTADGEEGEAERRPHRA